MDSIQSTWPLTSPCGAGAGLEVRLAFDPVGDGAWAGSPHSSRGARSGDDPRVWLWHGAHICDAHPIAIGYTAVWIHRRGFGFITSCLNSDESIGDRLNVGWLTSSWKHQELRQISSSTWLTSNTPTAKGCSFMSIIDLNYGLIYDIEPLGRLCE